MDRQAFTTGQLIPNAQLLGMEKGKLVALGYALEAIMGAGGTVVSGLACTPTATPSLQVVVGRGSIMTTAAIDGVAYSDLGTDSNATIKQGILQEPGVTLTLTPPATSGYSQVYLIQASQSDADTSTTVPFYNASNPAQQYNGPNNSGNATLTLRQSKCVVSLKAGAAASTGSQAAPSPDLGNVGLYTITLVNGQTSITAGQIVQLASAPFVPVTLPGIPVAVQANSWSYAVASGTNTLTATLTPQPPSLVDGMTISVFCPNANTGAVTLNINGLGAYSVVRKDGAAAQANDIPANSLLRVTYKGGVWRSVAPMTSELNYSVTNYLSGHLTIGGRIQPYTTPGTYTFTLPSDVYAFGCSLWGAGGGGGGAASLTSGGSGGGGGDYEEGSYTCQAGSTIAITVGSGGSGGASGGSSGGNGGLSSLQYTLPGGGSTATIVANGGQGGGGSTSGSATVQGSGGTGSGGLISRPGYIGGTAYNPGGGNYIGGPGGQAYTSPGAGANYGTAGNPGTVPGGGGSGSANNAAGGTGGNGVVIIRY